MMDKTTKNTPSFKIKHSTVYGKTVECFPLFSTLF